MPDGQGMHVAEWDMGYICGVEDGFGSVGVGALGGEVAGGARRRGT